jgi:hypothetical protein
MLSSMPSPLIFISLSNAPLSNFSIYNNLSNSLLFFCWLICTESSCNLISFILDIKCSSIKFNVLELELEIYLSDRLLSRISTVGPAVRPAPPISPVFTCIYINIYLYEYACILIYAHIYMHACMYVYIHI